MSKPSARDFFMAGWNAARNHRNQTIDHSNRHFEKAWREMTQQEQRVDIGAEDRLANNGHPGSDAYIKR